MSNRNLRDIVMDFSGKCVLIVGDVMLDEYIWGEARRISPEAPVPVVEVRRRSYTPGGAANTAANILTLGGRARLGGVVGSDRQAERLLATLRESAIDCDGLVSDPERQTTTKTRILAHNHQVARMDTESRAPLPAPLEDRLLEWANKQIRQVDACVLSDYAKGVISGRFAEQFIKMARLAGKPVIVDPKGKDPSKYRGATVVKPNLHEVEQLIKKEIQCESSLFEAGRLLSARLAGAALLITRGSQGMSLFEPGREPLHIPTAARNVYDVTGAGDTVVSVLAMTLAAGGGLDEAAHLANLAAGIVVGKLGTSAVEASELLRVL
jgi:D-beta-D-heptose 7-phosphate kinase/D-beta-D-heptose 1-phosphate adenosyltransferase